MENYPGDEPFADSLRQVPDATEVVAADGFGSLQLDGDHLTRGVFEYRVNLVAIAVTGGSVRLSR